MRFCIINTRTNQCTNIIELNSINEFTTVNHEESLAPDHTGEIGWIWDNTHWVPDGDSVLTTEHLSNKIRQKRDKYLKLHIDSMNPMRWESLSQVQKNNWMIYRQQLLDIPQQQGFPTNIVWPVKP